MSVTIKNVSISLNIADKDYGSGSERYFSLKGEYKEGIPLADIKTVVEDSCDMFLASWQSILAAQYAQKGLTPETFKQQWDEVKKRTEAIRRFLKKEFKEQPLMAEE